MGKRRNKKKNHHNHNNIKETKKVNSAEAKVEAEKVGTAEIEAAEIEAAEISAAEIEAAEIEAAEISVAKIEAEEIEEAEIEAAEISVAKIEAEEIEEAEIEAAEISVAKIEAEEIEEAEIEAAEISVAKIEAEEIEEAEIEAAEISVAEIEAEEISAAEIEAAEAVMAGAVMAEIEAETEEASETAPGDAAAVDIDIEIIDKNYTNKGVETVKKEKPKPQRKKPQPLSERARFMTVSSLKVLVPVAMCVIVIAAIISFAISKKTGSPQGESEQFIDEPLQENAYENVNNLIDMYFKALAEGDTETITALTDYIDETSLITDAKRSEFIEEYTNVTCYTKPGLEENSYFAYVTYDTKLNGVDTVAPGLYAFYIYTAQDGSLKIDGDRDERVEAAFKLVTNQDDVVDLYNRIDVRYKEVVASDEALKTFMDELPGKVKTAVGEALAQIEGKHDESGTESADDSQMNGGQPQNQTTNQHVKATATVNVRKSDSEEADRIGKVSPGTELVRVEERANGWSKIIYEGKEAYIKSDYLEVISTEAAADGAEAAPASTGSVKAKTNVNVRNGASQDSPKIGVAQAGKSYEVVENLGEWYKIKYNATTGYVKAEFFVN